MSFVDRIKEAFTTSESDTSHRLDMKSFIQGGHRAGTTQYGSIRGIYSGRERSPHDEMEVCTEIYKRDPVIVEASQLLTNAILGRDLNIEHEDDEVEIFLNQNVLSKLREPLREGIENMVVKGNGYIEVVRDSQGTPIDFKTVPRAEDMFVDYGRGFEVTRYIKEMPRQMDYDSHSIAYPTQRKRLVHGIEFEPNEIIHLKYGTSFNPIYGRSGLASAIDSGRILHELERDMAVLARWKSIGYKFNNITDEDGEPIGDEEWKNLKQQIQNREQFEDMFVSGKKIEKTDMSYQGEFANLQPGIEYIKQKITGVLAPSFYIHGSETNYAVAKEQKNSYYLSVQALREQINVVNQVINEIVEARFQTDQRANLVFGDFDFATREDKVEETRQMWNDGLITIGQAKEMFPNDISDKIEIPEGIPEDAYKFELTDTSPPLEEAVKNATEEE